MGTRALALVLFLASFSLEAATGLVRYFETIADMKAQNNVGNYNLFVVSGTAVLDDGLGGIYSYVSTSSETADGDEVITPDTLPGRFVLVDRNRIFAAQNTPTFLGSLTDLADSNFATNTVAMVTITNNPPVLGDPVLGNYLLTRPAIINTNAEDPNDLIQSTVDTSVVWHLADSVDQYEEVTFATLSDINLQYNEPGSYLSSDGTNITDVIGSYVDVSLYGATPDDATDDLIPFQAAIDQMIVSTNRRRTLVIPQGYYHLSGPLRLYDNTVSSLNYSNSVHRTTNNFWTIKGLGGGVSATRLIFTHTVGNGIDFRGRELLIENLQIESDATREAATGYATATDTMTFAPGTITATSANFETAGFEANDIILVSGSASNDWWFRVESVSGSVLTINENPNAPESEITAEGPTGSVTIITEAGHGIYTENWPRLSGQSKIQLKNVRVINQPVDGIAAGSWELPLIENVDSQFNGRYGLRIYDSHPDSPGGFPGTLNNVRLTDNGDSGGQIKDVNYWTLNALESYGNYGRQQFEILSGRSVTLINPDFEDFNSNTNHGSYGAVTTVSFSGATLSDSAAGIDTGIFSAGRKLLVYGSTFNDRMYEITSSTASTIVITGDTFHTESAGDSVTLIAADTSAGLRAGCQRLTVIGGHFSTLGVAIELTNGEATVENITVVGSSNFNMPTGIYGYSGADEAFLRITGDSWTRVDQKYLIDYTSTSRNQPIIMEDGVITSRYATDKVFVPYAAHLVLDPTTTGWFDIANLTGDLTLSITNNPAPFEGQEVMISLDQGGVGGDTVTWYTGSNGSFWFPSEPPAVGEAGQKLFTRFVWNGRTDVQRWIYAGGWSDWHDDNEELDGFVRVRAVNDGSADASQVIQSYIDTYDSVFIPPGTYLLTAGVEFDDNDHIVGVPGRTIFQRGYDSANKESEESFLLSANGHGYSIGAADKTTSTNVTVSGITFSTPYALSATNSRFVQFESSGNRFTDMSADFTAEGFQSGWKIKFKHTASNDSEFTIDTVGTTNLTVTSGFTDESVTDHVFVKAAEFSGGHLATMWTDDYRIENCDFIGIYGDWNAMLGGKRGVIKGNKVSGSHLTNEDGLHAYMGQDLLFSDNYSESGDDAFAVGNAHGYTAERIQLVNSVAHSVNGNALSIATAQSGVVTNSTTIRDISVSGLKGTWSFGGIRILDGYHQQTVTNIFVQDVELEWNGIVPTSRGYGLNAYYVGGLTLLDIDVGQTYRRAMWLEEVQGAHIERFKFSNDNDGGNSEPILIEGGSNIEIHDSVVDSTEDDNRIVLQGNNRTVVENSRVLGITDGDAGIMHTDAEMPINNYPSANTTVYYWELSSSGTDEYYLQMRDASWSLPWGEPNGVGDTNGVFSIGAVGSLVAGEWDWANNDTLPGDTIYVRQSHGGNPDPDDWNPSTLHRLINWSDANVLNNEFTYASGNSSEYPVRFDASSGDGVVSIGNDFGSPITDGNNVFGGSDLTEFVFSANVGDLNAGYKESIWIGAEDMGVASGSPALLDLADSARGWSLDPTSDEAVNSTFRLPTHWPTLSKLSVKLYMADRDGGASSDDIQMFYDLFSLDDGGLLSASSVGSASQSFIMDGTQWSINEIEFSTRVTITNAQDRLNTGRFLRDANNGSGGDDYTNDIYLIGARLTRERNP